MLKNIRSGALFVGMISLLAAASPARAALQPFHYWVRVAQTSLSCADEAQALAQRFTRETTLKVTDARCTGVSQLPADGRSFSLYALDLTYLAEAKLYPYVAVYGGGVGVGSYSPGDSDGAYATYASCLGDMAQQSANFEGQTGLKVLTARCEPGQDQFHTTFVLKIEGAGNNPVSTLQTLEFAFRGKPDADFRQQGLNLVTRSGATIVRAWDNSVLYYTHQYMPVRLNVVQLFRKPDECKVQLGEVREMYVRNRATNVIARCLPVDGLFPGEVSLEVIDDSGSEMSSDFGYGAPKYYSFEECMNDRQRALEAAPSSIGATLGGLCHPDEMNDRQYVLEIYSTL